MANPFSHTLRSLSAHHRPSWFAGLGLVLVLLTAWAVWFGLAPVTLHAESAVARLEADRRPHAVATRVDGEVVDVLVVLGDRVTAGQPLVDLDATAARRRLDAERARREGARGTAERLERQITAERRQLDALRNAERVERDELDALWREAEAEATHAEAEAERIGQLFTGGVVGRSEVERAESEASRLRAAAEARDAARASRRQALRVDEAALAVRIEELEADRASVLATVDAHEAEIERLDHALDQHRVRATIDGIVGQLAELRAGAVVTTGTQIASVVPEGSYRMIADFPPSAAAGRIQPGQTATIRFDGFPWTQFGSLRATTARVASEPRQGRIRVELIPDPASAPAIPLQHGLPGRVEVAVEETTPARLLLRVAGRRLGPTAGPASTTP
ncbi:MAG: HlyD family efflux transporter periplasmic adaptor subunit [Acidobacteriota bacterium]